MERESSRWGGGQVGEGGGIGREKKKKGEEERGRAGRKYTLDL